MTYGSREATSEDRANAVKRDITNSTSNLRITPGMRRAARARRRRSFFRQVWDAIARRNSYDTQREASAGPAPGMIELPAGAVQVLSQAAWVRWSEGETVGIPELPGDKRHDVRSAMREVNGYLYGTRRTEP